MKQAAWPWKICLNFTLAFPSLQVGAPGVPSLQPPMSLIHIRSESPAGLSPQGTKSADSCLHKGPHCSSTSPIVRLTQSSNPGPGLCGCWTKWKDSPPSCQDRVGCHSSSTRDTDRRFGDLMAHSVRWPSLHRTAQEKHITKQLQ